jgi:putative ABC transport system substrate-binding protein
MSPDVILTYGTTALRAAQQATRTTPIVFTVLYEPVAQGFVQSLSHPGGNITGFTNVEPNVGGKWVELLTEIAPGVSRLLFIFNPEASPYSVMFYRSIATAATKFGVDAAVVPVQDVAEIEQAIAKLAREPGGGLIAGSDNFTIANRKPIIELAARHRIPAIYGFRDFMPDGGLMFYGADLENQFRLAVGYVDRIFRGESPADLAVQQPTKFELIINLKTAKALSLDVPLSLQQGADEVIE